MSYLKGLVLIIIGLYSNTSSFCQNQEKFELVQTDRSREGVIKKSPIKIYNGNVELVKNDIYLYCDSAYQYLSENKIEAFGNVKVIKAEAYTFTGNRMIYLGDKNKAYMNGNVFLRYKNKEKRRRHLKFKLN